MPEFIDTGKYTGANRRRRQRLHLDPTISWGHILTTVTMFWMIVAAWIEFDHRVTRIEAATEHNRDLIQMASERAQQEYALLRTAVEKNGNKIDRLIERDLK